MSSMGSRCNTATLSDNVFSPSWPDGCSSPFDSGASPSLQANRVSKISGCGKVGWCSSGLVDAFRVSSFALLYFFIQPEWQTGTASWLSGAGIIWTSLCKVFCLSPLSCWAVQYRRVNYAAFWIKDLGHDSFLFLPMLCLPDPPC